MVRRLGGGATGGNPKTSVVDGIAQKQGGGASRLGKVVRTPKDGVAQGYIEPLLRVGGTDPYLSTVLQRQAVHPLPDAQPQALPPDGFEVVVAVAEEQGGRSARTETLLGSDQNLAPDGERVARLREAA